MSADAILWSSEAWASAPDAALLARTRDGSAEAFGELWRRHLPAAYAVANRHRGRSAPEDVVAEAASRVLALVREGRGPDENFRAYFLSAVRTVAIDQGRRELRLVPTEDGDLEDLAPAADDPLAGLATDEEGLALVRAAFAELPERDQRILWHTTVEGAAPRAIAPALGMTANAVSVRAMRAREQLRAAYLDARAARELAGADSEECRWTVTHLGAFVRGRLPKRQTERARAHVAGCPHAAALAADLRVIHDRFPALVVPLVVAAGLATPGFVTGGVVAGLSAVGAVAGTSEAASGPAGASPAGAAGVGPAAHPLLAPAGLRPSRAALVRRARASRPGRPAVPRRRPRGRGRWRLCPWAPREPRAPWSTHLGRRTRRRTRQRRTRQRRTRQRRTRQRRPRRPRPRGPRPRRRRGPSRPPRPSWCDSEGRATRRASRCACERRPPPGSR